ncbi:DUF4190 domain-containing protein [Mycobacterium avium]|uniref:DUF4190 domain-containing protein n=1 Tax=Mycobacterium avium TaxID=1764 RepID=UPI002939E158|nr:DUF4190 domain-containing protein [Mycobacterium avium]MDV3292389.1 DUF4190 domain-containing protein [Mycobacterium avium subsp. hominissuis]
MTAPGGGFGESAQHDHHGDQAHGDKPNDDATSAPHAQPAPWEPPAGSVPPPYPPPGYGPPGYPGGYYPGPDYGGYPPQPPLLGGQPGTNGLAIASLIASFTGLLCGIGSVVAIVLGAIALDQIKRTRQDGFGLAVAGIVIGIATLVVTLVVVLFALHTH